MAVKKKGHLKKKNPLKSIEINMTEENIGQRFRLKVIDEKRNCFIEEIKQNELINKKHKKICKILNYTEHLLILASAVTGCASISVFAFLIGIPVGITSSATTITIFAVIARIEKYKTIFRKKRK